MVMTSPSSNFNADFDCDAGVISIELENLNAVENLAKQFSTALTSVQNTGLMIYLNGDLGVGKTTFVRAVLNYLGYKDRVKSPTYTIVESYEVGAYEVHHFDLYRLADPEELLYLGLEDYFTEQSVAFIEWPEKGGEELPQADFIFDYQYNPPVSNYEQTRTLKIMANTNMAKTILQKLVDL